MSYESRLAKHNTIISLDMSNSSAQYASNASVNMLLMVTLEVITIGEAAIKAEEGEEIEVDLVQSSSVNYVVKLDMLLHLATSGLIKPFKV